MDILIRNAQIIDKRSSHYGSHRDILIRGNKIARIGENIGDSAEFQIEGADLFVTNGFIDLRANFRDPGEEHKETLESGARAARRGGYTRVVLMPSVHPVVDSGQGLEYLLSKSRQLPVQLYAVGALSKNLQGRELAEMADMQLAGAIAWGDDKENTDTGLMIRALEYSRNFNGLIYAFPHDPSVSPGATVHEGLTSLETGLTGMPSLSEELRIMRDIELLRHYGGRMHISPISTAGGVALIRRAKQDGLHITCSVAAHQLVFTDQDLRHYDVQLKVLPPFRTETDRKALIAGLADGTIDAIVSDHCPQDAESKIHEWNRAAWGISSIESTFCTALTALEGILTPEEIVRCFNTNPSAILGISQPVIEEGENAELTVFSTAMQTHFSADNWQSKSANTPFMGKELRGFIFSLADQ